MRRLPVFVVFGLGMGATFAAGAAVASPDSSEVIQACVHSGNGKNLRIVSSPDDCRNSEMAIHWNVEGPAGLVGPAGADGMDGADGADGTDGANGMDGADGADGVDGMDGANGADGMDGADGATGQAGPPGTALGFYKVESPYPTQSLPPRSTHQWSAFCDPGDEVTGGGFDSAHPFFADDGTQIDGGSLDSFVWMSRPNVSLDPEGWQVGVNNNSTLLQGGFRVYAMCADMTP